MLFTKGLRFNETNSDLRYAGKLFPLTAAKWSHGAFHETTFEKDSTPAIYGPNGLEPIFQDKIEMLGEIVPLACIGSLDNPPSFAYLNDEVELFEGNYYIAVDKILESKEK